MQARKSRYGSGPDDQAKRDNVVEQADGEERAPGAAVGGHAHAKQFLTSAFRIIAASPTRSNTIVSGGNVLTRTPAKYNAQPHNTDNSSKVSHSLAFMCRLLLIETVSVIGLPFIAADPGGERQHRALSDT